MVVPQNGWFIMENPINMGWFGISPFKETPLWTLNFFVGDFRQCSAGGRGGAVVMSGKLKKKFYAGTLQFTNSFAKKDGGGEFCWLFFLFFFAHMWLVEKKQKNDYPPGNFNISPLSRHIWRWFSELPQGGIWDRSLRGILKETASITWLGWFFEDWLRLLRTARLSTIQT